MSATENNFKPYHRKQIAELRPYRPGEILDCVASVRLVSAEDRE